MLLPGPGYPSEATRKGRRNFSNESSQYYAGSYVGLADHQLRFGRDVSGVCPRCFNNYIEDNYVYTQWP
ncbi:hypothetical protein ANO14919_003090 [Xylariales sp. No.14919]|nr:hypothetical protein ANO14919_003090 [Xylariales sp. No.14919]